MSDAPNDEVTRINMESIRKRKNDLASRGLNHMNDMMAIKTAQARVAQLEAENARLREALEDSRDHWMWIVKTYPNLVASARAAQALEVIANVLAGTKSEHSDNRPDETIARLREALGELVARIDASRPWYGVLEPELTAARAALATS